MQSLNIEIQYGDAPEGQFKCQLHGETHTRFGCLIDANGHKWRICVDCIDNFWSGNQAMITRQRIEDEAERLINERLFGNG